MSHVIKFVDLPNDGITRYFLDDTYLMATDSEEDDYWQEKIEDLLKDIAKKLEWKIEYHYSTEKFIEE